MNSPPSCPTTAALSVGFFSDRWTFLLRMCGSQRRGAGRSLGSVSTVPFAVSAIRRGRQSGEQMTGRRLGDADIESQNGLGEKGPLKTI